ETPETPFIATVPADSPFLPSDLVTRLRAALEAADASCAIAASSGATHPVAGLWRVDLAGALDECLSQGMRALHRFAEAQACAVAAFGPVEIGGQRVDPFFNVNTP